MKFAPTFINSTASSALRPASGLTEAWDGVPRNVNLAEMVATSGAPSKVEFRAAGTGYAAPTPCEDCGKSYAKCKCDEPETECEHEWGDGLCCFCDDEDK